MKRLDSEDKKILNAELYAEFTVKDLDHIAGMIKATRTNGYVLMIKALYEGGDLKKHLEKGPLTQAEYIKVRHGFVAAVQAMLWAGIVHRDLKPANIMLLKNEKGDVTGIKLIDFGIVYILPNMDFPFGKGFGPLHKGAGTKSFVIMDEYMKQISKFIAFQIASVLLKALPLKGRPGRNGSDIVKDPFTDPGKLNHKVAMEELAIARKQLDKAKSTESKADIEQLEFIIHELKWIAKLLVVNIKVRGDCSTIPGWKKEKKVEG